MFFPVYQRVREELSAGTIGEVGLVQANFGKNIMHVKRMTQRDLGGGALLSLGSYPIQLAVLVFGEAPQKIVASGILTDQGETYLLSPNYFSHKMYSHACFD